MTTAVADSTSEEQAGSCSRQECPVGQGGSCLEGHGDPLDCSFFELITDEVPAPVHSAVGRVALPDGEALRNDELHRILRAHPASTVVPLGRVGTGKTTLMALSYHLVRSERIEGLKFAGSETIIGLARRAHHASFASGRERPVTPRTEKEESGLYLHLGMRWAADDARAPVLFSDLSGEDVEGMMDGEAISVVKKALLRADHVPIVIDGKVLADPNQRSRAVLEARTLLKMLEKYELRRHCKICLVVTKADLLVGVELAPTIEAIGKGTLAQDCPSFATADRPSSQKEANGDPVVALGDGIGEFITHVTQRQEESTPTRTQAQAPLPSPLLATLWARS